MLGICKKCNKVFDLDKAGWNKYAGNKMDSYGNTPPTGHRYCDDIMCNGDNDYEEASDRYIAVVQQRLNSQIIYPMRPYSILYL